MNSNRSIRIVLVQPRNPLNLMAASRAAANFGFNDVVVVSPYEPVWEEACAARGAGKWLRHTRRVATLLDALKDRNWVLGTSCLTRRRTEPSRILSLEQLAVPSKKLIARDRVALLFGSEKRGLSNRDLELCHAVIRIPTAPGAPSMNLGQAVAVCCYALQHSFEFPSRAPKPPAPTASLGEVARLMEALDRILEFEDAGRKELSGLPRKRRVRLQQMLLRLSLSSADVALILGILRDLSWRLQRGAEPSRRP